MLAEYFSNVQTRRACDEAQNSASSVEIEHIIIRSLRRERSKIDTRGKIKEGVGREKVEGKLTEDL